MATDLGKAYVQIIPSAEGISGKIKNVLEPEANAAGQSAGTTIGNQIASFATKAIAALGVGKMISDAMTNGMDFESTMAKASTLFSGTKEELGALQSQLIDISSATGVAASELAEAAYSAESASVPMGNLGGMIESSAKLATAGFTDIDTALSATAKTMNAYGMMSDDTAKTQENLEKVQRVLIQTQNKGITTVGELGASLANVTPTASAAGVSFEQVGAALALMTAQGTPTAQATTQLRSAIAELEKSGTTASKALEEAAKGTEYAGKSFVEMMAEGADLGDVMEMLQTYADNTGVSMLDLWSSVEGGNAAMAIAKDVAAFDEDLASMATTADVVGEAYSAMSETASFKLDQFKNSLKNLGIEAFSASADTLIGCLDGISRGLEIVKPPLETLGEAFTNLIGAIGTFIADSTGMSEDFDLMGAAATLLADVITTLADVMNFLAENMNIIGPIVAGVVAGFAAFQTIQFVVGLIQGVSAAFGVLNVVLLANPIGLIVAAIAGLVVGLIALYNNCEGFKNFVDGAWEGIKSFAADIAEFFGNVGKIAGAALETMKTNVSETWDNIKSGLSEKWENIKTNASQTWENMKTTASTAWENMKNDASTKWDNMKSKLSGTYENMKTLTSTGLSFMKTTVSTSLNAMKSAYDSHGGGMQGVAAAMWAGLQSAYSAGFNILNQLTDGKLGEITNAFTSKFSDLISQAWNWGSDLVHNIADGITAAIDYVKDAASNVADAIAEFLHFSEPDVGPLSNFHTFMPDMIDMLTSGIEQGIPSVKSMMDRLSENMVPQYNIGASSGNEVQNNSVSNITINVYGAANQSVDELAEIIEEKLYNATIRGSKAYA